MKTPRVGGKSIAIKGCSHLRRGTRSVTFRDKGQPVFLTVPSPVGAQARGAAHPRGVEEPEHSQKEIGSKEEMAPG